MTRKSKSSEQEREESFYHPGHTFEEYDGGNFDDDPQNNIWDSPPEEIYKPEDESYVPGDRHVLAAINGFHDILSGQRKKPITAKKHPARFRYSPDYAKNLYAKEHKMLKEIGPWAKEIKNKELNDLMIAATSGDDDAKRKIMNFMIYSINRIFWKIFKRKAYSDFSLEMEHVVIAGIWEKLNDGRINYDSERGGEHSVRTYLHNIIFHTFCSKNARAFLTNSIISGFYHYYGTYKKMSKEKGRGPTYEEFSEKYEEELSYETFEKFKIAMEFLNFDPDECEATGNPEWISATSDNGEFAEEIEDALIRHEISAMVRNRLDRTTREDEHKIGTRGVLSERDRYVLDALYGLSGIDKVTQEAFAETLYVTPQAIDDLKRQMIKKRLSLKLRHIARLNGNIPEEKPVKKKKQRILGF